MFDEITRMLRRQASAPVPMLDSDDARAILDHIAALTAERDKTMQHATEQHQAADRIAAIAAQMQAERDAAVAEVVQIVAWLRRQPPLVPMSSQTTMPPTFLQQNTPQRLADAIAAGAHKESGHVADD
jgi:hypothetical protein